MLLYLLVLAGSLFLLPAFILAFLFVAALADYLLGGGPAATHIGSNADPAIVGQDLNSAESALIDSSMVLLKPE